MTRGETRSKHAAVIAAFTQQFVRTGAFGPDMARVLRSLFDRRLDADYGAPDIPSSEARAAVADAQKFVSTVTDWLNVHSPP